MGLDYCLMKSLISSKHFHNSDASDAILSNSDSDENITKYIQERETVEAVEVLINDNSVAVTQVLTAYQCLQSV